MSFKHLYNLRSILDPQKILNGKFLDGDMQRDTNTLKPNNVEIYTQREKRIFGVFFALRI